MTPYDKISLSRLETLHPKLRVAAIAAYKECWDKVAQHRVTYALRTAEEQAWIYASGRTRPGPRLTNAKPWQSTHQYGLAFDFCLLEKGKMWDINWDDPNDTDKKAEWLEIVEFYEMHGWNAGYRWKGFVDNPHMEKTFGYTWKDLNAKRLLGQMKDGYVIIL